MGKFQGRIWGNWQLWGGVPPSMLREYYSAYSDITSKIYAVQLILQKVLESFRYRQATS